MPTLLNRRPGRRGLQGQQGIQGIPGTGGGGGGGVTTGMPSGWVDVTDPAYGAIGNGYALSPTDDTPAFLAAIATGQEVYIPRQTASGLKNYLITNTLKPVTAQTLFSDVHAVDSFADPSTNPYYAISGVIVSRCTNIPVISLENANCNAKNIGIMQDMAFPQVSGGAHFAIGTMYAPPAWGWSYLNCDNCASTYAYRGFWMRGKQSFSTISNCITYRAFNAGFYVHCASPSGAYLIKNCQDQASGAAQGTHNVSAYGLYIATSDTANVDGFYGLMSKIGISSDPAMTDNGPISHLYMKNINVENATAYGISGINIGLPPGTPNLGAYPVEGMIVNNIELWHTEGGGVNIGPSVYGLKIQNGTFSYVAARSNTTNSGASYVDSGESNSIDGVLFANYDNYQIPIGAALYGINGNCINNLFWNYDTFIDYFPVNPGFRYAYGVNDNLLGYGVHNNTGYPGPYNKTPANSGFTPAVGIKMHIDSGTFSNNRFGWCTTPIDRSDLGAGPYVSRGRGNLGVADWG